MQLLFQLAVFDQIDSDVAVDIAEHVEVDIDTVIDLDDVLLAIFRAVRVLNDRDALSTLSSPKSSYTIILLPALIGRARSAFIAIYIHNLPPFCSHSSFTQENIFAWFLRLAVRLRAHRPLCLSLDADQEKDQRHADVLPQSAWKK